MAIETAAVTVATTATAIAAGGGVDRGNVTTITVKPAVGGGAEVFLGPAGVTTATGLPLGGGISLNLSTRETLYGIVATGTVAVRVMEHG